MAEYTILTFNTPTGLTQFQISNDICIDPKTNKPYKYAVVHGNTWQTTLSAEMPDIYEAFTPGACPELNHRGIYVYSEEDDVYNKPKYDSEYQSVLEPVPENLE